MVIGGFSVRILIGTSPKNIRRKIESSSPVGCARIFSVVEHWSE